MEDEGLYDLLYEPLTCQFVPVLLAEVLLQVDVEGLVDVGAEEPEQSHYGIHYDADGGLVELMDHRVAILFIELSLHDTRGLRTDR